MPEQIRTDVFAKSARERFPHLRQYSDTQVISYFNDKYPDVISHLSFLEPPREPSTWDKLTSGIETTWTQKKVLGSGALNTAKEGLYTSESDKENALLIKQQQQRGGRRRGERRAGHVGRGMQEFIDLASEEEIGERFDVSIAEADELRKIDAQNHIKLREIADEKIANNEKIQGVRNWYAENPVEGFSEWWSADNIAYGLGEFAGSYLPIMGAGIIGSLAGPGGTIAAVGSMAYTMEAGNHFNTAYDVARDELGLDEAQSFQAASTAATKYGIISAMLESLVPSKQLHRMLMPREFNKRFASAMMNSSHRGINKLGRLRKEAYDKAMDKAYAQGYSKFGNFTRHIMGDNFFGRNAWRMGRYMGVRSKDGLLEGATEASQYLAEQAVLADMKKEEITSDWIKEKIDNPEFIQSFALGTYAALIPGAGPGSVAKTDAKTIQDKYDKAETEDGQTVTSTDSGTRIKSDGLDPREEGGTWRPVSEEEEFTSKDDKIMSPLMDRLRSYVSKKASVRPQTKDDGTKIIDLGAAILEDITSYGFEAIMELESHLMPEQDRKEILELLGGALKEADDANNPMFNIRVNENGEINLDDVRNTLRGIVKHGLKLKEQDLQTGLGVTQKKQSIAMPKGMKKSIQNAIIKQMSTPSQFGALNISKLAEEEMIKRIEREQFQSEKQNKVEENKSIDGTPNQTPKNKFNDQQQMFDEKGNLGLHESLREKFLDGKEDEVQNDINGLKHEGMLELTEALEISERDLDHTPKGNISANKKNKKFLWDMFNKAMENDKADYDEAAELGFINDNNSHEQNKFDNPFDNHDTSSDNTQSNTSPRDNQQDIDFGDDGEGMDLSRAELQEGEEVQPKAYEKTDEGFVPTPETQEITERLSTHFPEIRGESLQQVFDEDGVEVAGKAFSGIAQWSQDKARIDDMPHEYFHIYLDAFADAPIIKAGIKKFSEGAATLKEAKEQFTELVGNYYANRITDKSLAKKIKLWIRQAWLHFKKKFGKLSKEDYAEIVGEQFFQGARPSVKQGVGVSTLKTIYYSQISEEENTPEDNVDDDGRNTEIAILDNLKNDIGYFIENVFLAELKTSVPKSFLARDVPEMANSLDTYEEFESALLNQMINTFGAKVPRDPDSGKLIINSNLNETLRTMYLQFKSRIPLAKYIVREKGKDAKIVNIDTQHGRIRYEMMFNHSQNDKGRWHKTLGGINVVTEYNRERPGVKNPQSFPENFMELQAKLSGDKSRFAYMPLKMVYKHVFSNDHDFTINDTRDLKLNEKWVNRIDHRFIDKFKRGVSPVLPFFFSTKDGDNQQMILSYVPTSWQGSQQKKFHGKSVDVTKEVDRQFLIDELEQQINAGFITKEQAKQLLDDADILAKSDINGQEPHIKEKVEAGDLGYSIILANHIRWQQIKGSDYLKRVDFEKGGNLMDMMNRLRIDFSEGVTPYGSGERRILWMSKEDIVIKSTNIDGEPEAWDMARPYGDPNDGTDGALWTGGQYLSKLGNQFGMDDVGEIKTSIRHLTQSEDNIHTYEDYIGLKMMETAPHAGMQIFKKGETEPFIEVVGQGKNTRFKVLKGEQAGMEFDSFGTDNEIKDASGKYSKGVGDGVVHVLPETATKVLIKSKSATTSTHPVNVHELLLDNELENIDEGRVYQEALSNHVKGQVKSKMDMLFSFRDSPKKLKDYLFKELREGEVPTELHKYLDLDENTLSLPSVVAQIISMLNNKIINGGMMRLRTPEGRGTKLYLKPKGALNIEHKSAIVSAQNTTIVNLVEKEMAESQGKKWHPQLFGWRNNHEKIKALNEYLRENKFMTNVFRMPIQGATKYEPRRVQQFLEGNHGNSVFLSNEDVFLLHDADFDGDTIFFERPEDLALLEAMEKLSETEWFNKRKKIVSTDMFTSEQKNRNLASRSDRASFYQDNGNAMFSQGMSVNAKTVANLMAYKNLSFADNSLPKGVRYEVRKPGEQVVMDYIKLDPKALSKKEIWELIHEVNGDDVVAFLPVGKNNKKQWQKVDAENLENVIKDGYTLHLRTTFENEMSNILQFSVDNPKLGLLSDIKFTPGFLTKRMFKRTDGNPIHAKMLYPLKMITKAFQYSSTRRGRNRYQNKLNMGEMMKEFEDMRNRFYNDNGTLKTDEEIAEIIAFDIENSLTRKRNGKSQMYKTRKFGTYELQDFTLDGSKLSAVELLLSEPDIYLDSVSEDVMRDYESTPLEYAEERYNYAHVESMHELKNEHITMIKELQNRDSLKDVMRVHKALEFAKEMASDFYGIFEKIAEEKGITSGEIKGIKYELSEDFIEFTEKWLPEYQKLDPVQQMITTLKFLDGSEHKNLKGKKTKKAFVHK